MEKIIVAIRTLNDNLKIVATRVDELEKRIDAIEARVDGIGASLTDSIHNLAAQTEARLAELTERVYALENAAPTVVGGNDVGDALDDILGVETVVESTVVEESTGVEEPAPTPAALDDVVKYVMSNKDAELTAPTPTPTPTKKKTVSTATSAVQKRAYARQYMVERGAKVEDLRSPAKIEEVMETEEFKTWVAAR